jgi:hypothetical protein
MSTSPPATPPSTAPNRRRLWFVLAAVGGLAVVILIVVLVVWRGGAAAPHAGASTARPVPSTSSAPVQLLPATPVPTVTDAAPAGPRHPSSCADIYTTDWASALAPLVLNPAWAEDPASGVHSGTDDAGLATVLEATATVTCMWGKASGGGDVGITTNVAVLTEPQQADVTARMKGVGYSCYDELKGLRCVTETHDEAGSWGESHFVREGLWLATKWVNASPEGYTHDMVNTVFPAA